MLVTKSKRQKIKIKDRRKKKLHEEKIEAQLETVKYDYSASVPSSHW